jgi:hypothetical protein
MLRQNGRAVLSFSQGRQRACVFPLYTPKGFAVTSECHADHHRGLQHGVALFGGTRGSLIASMRVDGICRLLITPSAGTKRRNHNSAFDADRTQPRFPSVAISGPQTFVIPTIAGLLAA